MSNNQQDPLTALGANYIRPETLQVEQLLQPARHAAQNRDGQIDQLVADAGLTERVQLQDEVAAAIAAAGLTQSVIEHERGAD